MSFRHGNQNFIVTFGLFDDGSPGEMFINTSMRAGSESDVNASDAAIAVSLALQYGCSVRELRDAMRRNPDGSPSGPLAAALDLVVEEMGG